MFIERYRLALHIYHPKHYVEKHNVLQHNVYMRFLNRNAELKRLAPIASRGEAAFIVLWGRRRIGKTRLLLEWVTREQGLYWVADESAASVQRQYFAVALEAVLPGFSEVEYPDWSTLFNRLARDATLAKWRGPLVIDEFPYLAVESPELPSILQRFIDHDAKRANLIVAICGSSQRMMQGLVLDAKAPLYGRAQEIMKLEAIKPAYIGLALDLQDHYHMAQAYGVWGGIPRYWELAAPFKDNILEAIEVLVLDPQGPLQDEPRRLLLEESPSALALRPILDVIGFGAHKLSEIGGRLGQPSTSLARPLDRLRELDFIERELPFGSSEKTSKKSLYKIKDPFLRFWFEAVAAKRSTIIQFSKKARLKWLSEVLPPIWAKAWEELCRLSIPTLFENKENTLFEPARRFWQNAGPEWDIVSQSLDQKTLLLGEVKWTHNTPSAAFIHKTVTALMAKGIPLPHLSQMNVLYAIFVPILPNEKLHLPANVRIFSAHDVLLCDKN